MKRDESEIQILRLAGAADGCGTSIGPCTAIAEVTESAFPEVALLAIGPDEVVRSHPAARSPQAVEVDARDRIVIPGLVNTHTHLDLTHIGPQPYPEDRTFVDWVDMIRDGRETDPEPIRASVQRGVAKSLRGGVVAVGDIAGVFGIEPLHALAQSPLIGVVGIELFGIGQRQESILSRMPELASAATATAEGSERVAWTWQPHAPYSVGRSIYERCARECADRGVPMMTHLAETKQEAEFVAHGTGPQVGLLKRLGAWDETCIDSVGREQSPVEYLAPVLETTPAVVAHVNQASDEDIARLARAGATVAYCPRASRYFRQNDAFGPHRFREMLDAGVNVALGTDSIVNLPPGQADRLSPLDDARLLVREDGLSAETALAMVTSRGATALGLDPGAFSLGVLPEARRIAGLGLVPIAADGHDAPPAERVMASELSPSLVRHTKLVEHALAE